MLLQSFDGFVRKKAGFHRALIRVLTRETARIMNTEEEKVRILIYEVPKEYWD
jgi:phenylpyruvate tautomerase PptA (4-oxalocrotonate tautomerase family)